MTSAAEPSSWFLDEQALAQELRRSRADDPPAAELPGYRLGRELGRGGQAVVFAAEQLSTGRTVAIKRFHDRPGQAARIQQRFLREIELVAALRHPAIVAVHDGGFDRDGRPFLVLEFVDGVPIDACTAVAALRATPTADRVRAVVCLFAAAVDGVAHAHQRGVIHRDLKPANLWVAADGSPRLLDFGLARALAESEFAVTQSLDGQFVGTLAYASPEQARGETVDVRSDVWSLGVLLYELLAGRRPFELPTNLRGALALLADPSPRALATVAPHLSADLGAIVHRCLQPVPQRRYQSAAELARDLRAHLAGAPIAARLDSTWYAVASRLRRWRRALLAAAAVALGLAIALLVTLGSLSRAEAAERDQRQLASRLQHTLDWLAGMVAAVDPERDGENVRLVDLLERSVPSLDVDFAADRAARITLRTTLVDVYEKLGRWPAAAQQCQRLLADLRAAHGEDAPPTLAARLALLRLAFLQERLADHGPVGEALLAQARARLGPWHATTLGCQRVLAESRRARRDLAGAAAIWQQMRAAPVAQVPAGFHARIDADLAAVAALEGRLAEALAQQREAVAALALALGSEAAETLQARADLAYYHNRMDQKEAARAVLAELEPRLIARYGAGHPRTLSVSEQLAVAIQDLGDPAAAVPRFEQVLAHRLARMGPRHRDTLGTQNNLAVAHAHAGDLVAAQATQERLVATYAELVDADAFDVANASANLGTFLMRQGRPREALGHYDAAVATAVQRIGAVHTDTATFQLLRGACRARTDDADGAERDLLAAHAVLLAALGDTHAYVQKAKQDLVALYEATGRAELAARFR
ncbi:MAG: serine/threonine protein kinase [Planctomycetes bacterium]|nr:serine/threonine protein kinase [Planctomycetota bacterium]